MARIYKSLAPAKINLWLEVLKKRSDGYHDLSTLMIPLDWGDIITLVPVHSGILLECSDPELPTDGKNLAYRSAESFFSYAPEAGLSGVKIILSKKIPVGAGLGGGSSDAATVLKGLNFLTGNFLSLSQLNKLAVSLGADVPFFLKVQPALVTGIGERCRFLRANGPFPEIPPFWFLIVKPDFSISTAWAYENLELTKNRVRIRISHLQEYGAKLCDILRNDLEEISIRRFPLIKIIKETLMMEGAEAALMTGSGSAVFGVFKKENKVSAVREELEKMWPDFRLFAVRGKY